MLCSEKNIYINIFFSLSAMVFVDVQQSSHLRRSGDPSTWQNSNGLHEEAMLLFYSL